MWSAPGRRPDKVRKPTARFDSNHAERSKVRSQSPPHVAGLLTRRTIKFSRSCSRSTRSALRPDKGSGAPGQSQKPLPRQVRPTNGHCRVVGRARRLLTSKSALSRRAGFSACSLVVASDPLAGCLARCFSRPGLDTNSQRRPAMEARRAPRTSNPKDRRPQARLQVRHRRELREALGWPRFSISWCLRHLDGSGVLPVIVRQAREPSASSLDPKVKPGDQHGDRGNIE